MGNDTRSSNQVNNFLLIDELSPNELSSYIRRKSPVLEVTPGFEPGNQGFADPCLTTWLCHHFEKDALSSASFSFGADDEARTRYLHLGKVALYQMSYVRIWCLRSESNQ